MSARLPYTQAVRDLDLAAHLQPWPWMVAGTPPLGIDVPSSDIDVVCAVDDYGAFAEKLVGAFSALPDFRIWQWTKDERSVICRFKALGWDFEIFGSTIPLARQKAVRHFEVERRLLAKGDDVFADLILTLKRLGVKTEPAFATVLDLDGNPYDALLDLHTATDRELETLLTASGFGTNSKEYRYAC